jgi:FSR family fosmidomycin resistance protein-like MFS transporter
VRVFRQPSFRAASLAHFAVDLLNGQRNILLAVLSGPLELTNTIIGLISTSYTLVAALLQPFLGILADRVGPKWVGTLGVLWMAFWFGLAVNVEGRAALLMLILVAIGSAAFHPAGTMEATGTRATGKARAGTLATSLFFLFGQGGLSLGPALGGLLLDRWGPVGLSALLIIVLPVGVNSGFRLSGETEQKSESPSIGSLKFDSAFRLFAVMAALRSWSVMALVTFLPKYFSDLGFSAAYFGLIASIYMAGSAVGGVLGGWLGERVEQLKLISWALTLAVVPVSLLAFFGDSLFGFPLAFISGLLLGSPHSIIVVQAQRFLPRSRGAASGLVLGFTFASGSIGASISGVIADGFGFVWVFIGSAMTAIAAAVIARSLRGKLNPEGSYS